MATINPYLNFAGGTEEAFNFYKSVFGGEFTAFSRFRDIPETEMCDGAQVSETELDRIMHVALPIGDGNVLMGTDVPESMGEGFRVGDNVSLSLNTESREETDRLYAALSADGSKLMAPAEAFWGAYFGMCTDRFGVSWMFNCDKK